ncbi:hypothetical protein [Corticimicrobacter populi]|uniref:hypothetical protein n=1 Tax=Corticimicrobacter populi TaxID=2175229 RepID=UPI003B8311F2
MLDEPTNDLDIETLELLESLLQDYHGTVLLVSHDRTFLNNVVTQTIAHEGNGKWRDYIGGYDDWLAQRPDPAIQSSNSAGTQSNADGRTPQKDNLQDGPSSSSDPATPAATARSKPTRNAARALPSWEQKELDGMPDAIAELEARQHSCSERLADGALYRDDPDEVNRLQAELQEIEATLEKLFARWEALEAKQQS